MWINSTAQHFDWAMELCQQTHTSSQAEFEQGDDAYKVIAENGWGASIGRNHAGSGDQAFSGEQGQGSKAVIYLYGTARKVLIFFIQTSGEEWRGFCTAPLLMQLVQTESLLWVPSTRTLTFWRFGFHLRLVLLWAWLILFPNMTPFPQMSHLLAISWLLSIPCKVNSPCWSWHKLELNHRRSRMSTVCFSPQVDSAQYWYASLDCHFVERRS